MTNNRHMIKKLQSALNRKGLKILFNATEFYSDDAKRPISVYSVKQACYDENKGRNTNIELFKSSSLIQVVLFLRDMWYSVNGKEIPNNNEIWNNIKEANSIKEV